MSSNWITKGVALKRYFACTIDDVPFDLSQMTSVRASITSDDDAGTTHVPEVIQARDDANADWIKGFVTVSINSDEMSKLPDSGIVRIWIIAYQGSEPVEAWVQRVYVRSKT